MKIGDKNRNEITDEALILFGKSLITWLTELDTDGHPSDNFILDEFFQSNNLSRKDIVYFSRKNSVFYELIKKAEDIQTTKIKGLSAAGIIPSQTAKMLLSEKSILFEENNMVKNWLINCFASEGKTSDKEFRTTAELAYLIREFDDITLSDLNEVMFSLGFQLKYINNSANWILYPKEILNDE